MKDRTRSALSIHVIVVFVIIVGTCHSKIILLSNNFLSGFLTSSVLFRKNMFLSEVFLAFCTPNRFLS